MGPQPPKAPIRGQLPQIDVVRVLTFVAVITVHVMSSTFSGDSTGGQAVLMLLHFTREVFFVITGFVLVHSYARREFDVPHFYRRRFTLVGIPYLVWSCIYYLVNEPFAPQSGRWWRELGFDLLTGRASYQLYFLLVSLQAYLLLPFLLALLRRTAGRHLRLLLVSVTLQAALLWLLDVPAVHARGAALTISVHADAMLPTYQVFLLVGALAAWHLPRLQLLVERHGRAIVLALVAVGAVAELVYRLRVPARGPLLAAAVFQPVMIPWSLAVATALYALGSRYAVPGAPRRLRRTVETFSLLSFGIYLFHPLVLDIFFGHGFAYLPGQVVSPTVATLVVLAAAVVASTVVVSLLQRSPLSQVLTGRPAVATPRLLVSGVALGLVVAVAVAARSVGGAL